jgi:hypothetical protein
MEDARSQCHDHNVSAAIASELAHSRADSRNHHTRSHRDKSPFFIDRLKRPNLILDFLPNDPRVGSEPFLQENPKDVSRSPELPPQHIIATASDKGESVSLLFKFGVIRVTSQPRKLRKFRLSEGVTTDLKADVQYQVLGSYTEKGDFTPYPEKLRSWSIRKPLRWYRQGWNDPLFPVEDGEKTNQSIEEMKRIAQYPLLLADRYFTGETEDSLQVGDEAYMLMFFTQAGTQGIFLLEGRTRIFAGRFKLKVRVHSYELKPKTHLYELDVKGWNDFTMTEVKK